MLLDHREMNGGPAREEGEAVCNPWQTPQMVE
jgi:hypothetical protein